jgi:2-polyprenyl-3-methyl-5-hydroxy-6-metoxy-1,4-benzoquinol methylase
MRIERGYRDDLAYIHDAGYGDIARDAAARLIKELSVLPSRAGTVVDVGCGTGILAQVVAEAGYDGGQSDVERLREARSRR